MISNTITEDKKSTFQNKFIEDRGNQLLFSNEKKDRKTSMQIYDGGFFVISGPCSYSGLNIPARLREWIYLPEDTREKQIVRCDYSIRDGKNELERFSNIESEIHYKGNKWLIKPIYPLEKERILRRAARNKWILQCNMTFFSEGKIQFQSKPLYNKAKEIACIDLTKVNTLTPIISYDYKTKKVSIYQDAEGIIYLKVLGRLEDYGAFHLNQNIGQYLIDWFVTEEYYYASLAGQEPIIVSSKLCRRKARGGRISKSLNFPYWGEEQETEVIFSSPTMTLSSIALFAIEVKEIIQKRGASLKGLLTNVWKTEQHKNRGFATIIKNILKKFQNKKTSSIYLTETAFEFKSSKNEVSFKHCFDHFFCKISDKNFNIAIGETISSFTTNKNSVIDEEISLLNHYKKLFGQKTLTFLAINERVSSRNSLLITDYYSLMTDTLILDSDDITKCQHDIDYLHTKLEAFNTKRSQIKEDSCIHPLTIQVITKFALYTEAFALLQKISTSNNIDDYPIINQYCLLMGITKKDFFKLLKEGNKKSSIETTKNWLTGQTNTFSLFLEQHLRNESVLVLFYIHMKLVTEESVALLSIKPQLKPLLPYISTFKKCLPHQVKIERIHITFGKGKLFEQEVSALLEAEGYFTQSNVVFAFALKTFEIDIVAIKEENITFISCKNHSTIKNQVDAEKALLNAANMLEFLCNQFNIQTGRLYFKANPIYAHNMKKKYHNIYWEHGILIQIVN